MSYVVKRTDEVIEGSGSKRLYFQQYSDSLPGQEFEGWCFPQHLATRFETAIGAKVAAEGWRGGRFKVVKLVSKKAPS